MISGTVMPTAIKGCINGVDIDLEGVANCMVT
jgi:hypothetical protein